MSGFDDEGLSAEVTLTSSMESAALGVQDVTGSMKTWLVRGMVSNVLCALVNSKHILPGSVE